jgi:tRNA pseudouridine38-40 synthase
MERYQVIIGYDGTAFGGMQRQDNARTIQGDFESALRKIGWTGRSILVAGRTDAGVHAAGQVVAFDLAWQHSTMDLCQALNANLPPDIGVQQAIIAGPEFHPRFDAISRTYRYHIFCRQHRDPLRERYAWRVWPELDFELLMACGNEFCGEHDFRAFGTPPQPGGSTIRNVFRADWNQEADQMVFEVCANAYLYRMVRRMVHLQVEVGLGKRSLPELREILSGSADGLIQGLAPANGLILQQVSYPG